MEKKTKKGKNAIVIAVVNNKGGVGKTATAQNLAAALAEKKAAVCMIDFDGQHNLTNRCENANRTEALAGSSYEGISISDYLRDPNLPIQPVPVKNNLYLIPSTAELSNDSLMMNKRSDIGILDNFCCQMKPVFDYIIIDCEPSKSVMMVNTIKAADLLIIPVSCQDALFGFVDGIYRTMEANGVMRPYFFLQTLYESRLRTSRDIRSQLLEKARENMMMTWIRRNEYINLAGNDGRDVFEFAPSSAGAEDYANLAREVRSILK